jgi:urea transport system substrate-binding protein
MKRSRRAVFGALAIGSLVVAACGGDDGGGAEEPAATTTASTAAATTAQPTETTGASATTAAAGGATTTPATECESLPEGDSVKVGVLHSLSGTMSISEVAVRDAELLAIKEINAAGGVLGHQIEPVVEDGASDWPTFAEKAEKLLTTDKVAAVFGAGRRRAAATDGTEFMPSRSPTTCGTLGSKVPGPASC